MKKPLMLVKLSLT